MFDRTLKVAFKISRRKREMGQVIAEIRSKSFCKICGRNHDLTFHHREPAKKCFVVGQKRTLCWRKLLREIAKCDMLCIKCHKRLHRDVERTHPV